MGWNGGSCQSWHIGNGYSKEDVNGMTEGEDGASIQERSIVSAELGA